MSNIGREYCDNDTYYQPDFENCIKNGIGLYRQFIKENGKIIK